MTVASRLTLAARAKPPRRGSRTPHNPHPLACPSPREPSGVSTGSEVRPRSPRLQADPCLGRRDSARDTAWAFSIDSRIWSRGIEATCRQKVIACVIGSSPEQSVEAPVVGVDRDNLYLAEAGLKGVLTKHRGSHDRRSLRSAGRPWRRAGRRPSSSRRQIGPVLRPHQAGPDQARGGARSPGSRCRPK
jgi:hypothetical protein